jgi:DUF1680 family protein
MTRRTAITLPLAAAAAQAGAGASTAKTVLEPFNYSGVRLLDGMLRTQCLGVRDAFLRIADDDLLHGFRKRSGIPEPPGKPLGGWYGGDVFNAFGQYLSGMIRLSRALSDSAIGEKAHRLMSAWAQYIEPDGYFFYSRRPITPHYIFDKTMGGLVDLVEYGGHRDAIPPMEKITKWAEANLDRSRRRPLAEGATYDGNGEWYTLGENLYRAYELTGDSRYRAFADVWRYPYYWDMFTRAEAPDPFGFHAYSHVNTLSSAAMAYSVSGESHYLDVIRNAYDWLARTQMYATGGFGPDEKLQRPDGSLGRTLESTWNNFETVCGSWAGFKLSRYLLRFTGEARYGDWIEKLVYNGIGAALPLQPDGSNFYYSEYNVNGGRKDYKYAKWSCCSGTLPQVTADYHNVIYFRNPEGLFVNLFVPSEANWTQGRVSVRVVQTTDFPDVPHTQIDVTPSEPAIFDISFRVPGWCGEFSAEVNEQPVALPAKPGTWARIRRRWQAGDQVRVRLPMHLRYAAVDQHHPGRVAILYGPVVLVRAQRARLPGDKEVSDLLRRGGPGLEFHATSTNVSRFTPFYKLAFGDLYEMYFDR